MAASKPPALPNIEALIEENGQITVGHLDPVGVVAVANDEHNALAMLRRRRGEHLAALLRWLDAAVHLALEEGEHTDEINPPRQTISRPAQGGDVVRLLSTWPKPALKRRSAGPGMPVTTPSKRASTASTRWR